MTSKRPQHSRATTLAIIAAALIVPGGALAAHHYHRTDTSTIAPQDQVIASAIPATVPDISKTPQSLRSKRDTLLARLNPDDPASVFDVIDAIHADPKLRTNCHEMAHDLGHKAYELYGFPNALNFTDAQRLDRPSIQDVCAGGYVHGVLEEAALHDPSFDKDPGMLCRTLATNQRASCFHGVGHALMFDHIRDIPLSIGGCRKAGDENDASRCFEGVWMELFWGNNDYVGTGGLGWDLKDPLATCRTTDTDAKPACFIYASFGYLREHPKDYAGTVRACTQNGLTATESEFCLKGLGITMISHFKNGGLEQSEAFVSGLSQDRKHAFYQGVIGYGVLSGIPHSKLAATCSAMAADAPICSAVLAAR